VNQTKDYMVTFYDDGDCDIDSFKVEAATWNEALNKAQDAYREAGYSNAEIDYILIDSV